MRKGYQNTTLYSSVSMTENLEDYKIGQIYWVDLGPHDEHIQGGWHPAVIVQNNVGNKFSPTISVVPITSSKKSKLPTHVMIKGGNFGLTRDSFIQCEGQRPINKSRIGSYIGELDRCTMQKVAKGCLINTPFLFFLDSGDIGTMTNNHKLIC